MGSKIAASQANGRTTPKDVFLYLLMIGTLYAGVISFILLLFQYVEALFPDQLNYSYGGLTDTIRSTTATLIVVWPVFVLSSWLLVRDAIHEPKKRQSLVRKSLIYLTLLVASIAIISYLVQLIYGFLGGELTTQFILKTVVVLVTTGLVFGYFTWDLRRDNEAPTRVPRTLAWVVSAGILASIIAGFFIVGTPGQQRARRFDEQRVNHLQALQWEIANYWQLKNQLPTALSDLKNAFTGFTPPSDPSTGVSYTYRPMSELSFELCAAFETEGPIEGQFRGHYPRMVEPSFAPGFGMDQNWQHGAGEHCFTRTIDPDYFKTKDRPL